MQISIDAVCILAIMGSHSTHGEKDMSNSTVLVALDSKYDDSMGAYDVAVLFDGERVWYEGGVYQSYNGNHTIATQEQKELASKIWMDQVEESYNYNKYANSNTFIGCTVKLKRSRKAPNGVALKVIDFIDGGYNSRFNTYDPNRVVVTDGVSKWTINGSCIDDVVKGVKERPYWITNSVGE